MKIVAVAAARPDFAYLDVGCAEGHITGAVAAALGLTPLQAHACDVTPQPHNALYTFAQNGPVSLPYQDESFDFITLFMAAHHFGDAPAMLREVRRVARPGAHLLIRDHDCTSEASRLFYDVVHAFYSCVLGAETTPAAFIAHYAEGTFASYRSREDWVALAEHCGFRVDGRVPAHGPWVQGQYSSDRFDSFYAFLTAA